MALSKSVVITARRAVSARGSLIGCFVMGGECSPQPDARVRLGREGVEGVQLDRESSEIVAAAAETIIAQLGPHGLDALINCAGVLVASPVELIPDDELRRAFEVNVIGPISLTRRLLPSLRAARGRIVNIGAISAQTTPPFFGASEAPNPLPLIAIPGTTRAAEPSIVGRAPEQMLPVRRSSLALYGR